MKIRHQEIDRLKAVSGVDEDIGVAGERGGRFRSRRAVSMRPQAGGATATTRPPRRRAAFDALGRRFVENGRLSLCIRCSRVSSTLTEEGARADVQASPLTRSTPAGIERLE